MRLKVIFDDTIQAPRETLELTGLEHFGALRYHKRSLESHVRMCVEKCSGMEWIVLKNIRELERLEHELESNTRGHLYLYWPSNLVYTVGSDEVTGFLNKMGYAQQGLHMLPSRAEDTVGLVLLEGGKMAEMLRARHSGDMGHFVSEQLDSGTLAELRDSLGLMNLNDPVQFVSFITSNFDVRHFNSIDHGNPYVITKRSSEKEKLKKECIYYTLLPPEMQAFFVQPYDYRDEGAQASYKMERLCVPDMAIQWIHGAIQPLDFERFLNRIFYFLAQRPSKQVPHQEGQRVAQDLYTKKVADRIASFKKMPAYSHIESIAGADTHIGGMDRLWERYNALYEKLARKRSYDLLVIGHGDLCFSNILHSKVSQVMKFVDPRGALIEEQLYTDPYYDVAKLSHSIMGGYDFMNYGLFEIEHTAELEPYLALDTPNISAQQAQFCRSLAAAGWDLAHVRLYEASLFISMLPLHIDIPKKVVAFMLTADAILTELERLN